MSSIISARRVCLSMEDVLKSHDTFGLLADVRPMPVPAPALSPAERNFLEISDFYEKNQRLPDIESQDIFERGFANRLKTFWNDPSLAAAVAKHDVHGILQMQPKNAASPEDVETEELEAPEAPEAPGWDPVNQCWDPDECLRLQKQVDAATGADVPDAPAGDENAEQQAAGIQEAPADGPTTMDEVMAVQDSFGLMDVDGIDAGAFSLEHVQSAAERAPAAQALETARRRPCQDFGKFKEHFAAVHQRLDDGTAVARKASERDIRPGRFFFAQGILHFVAEELEASRRGVGREPAAYNPRLRVISETGMEEDILQLSVIQSMYGDPRAFAVDLEPEDESRRQPARRQASGRIYILESLSRHPALMPYRKAGRLVKIGCTARSLDERIANAELSSTFLYAPVRKIAEFECRGVDHHALEGVLHSVFAPYRLDISFSLENGRTCSAKEWFGISADTAVEKCRAIAAAINAVPAAGENRPGKRFQQAGQMLLPDTEQDADTQDAELAEFDSEERKLLQGLPMPVVKLWRILRTMLLEADPHASFHAFKTYLACMHEGASRPAVSVVFQNRALKVVLDVKELHDPDGLAEDVSQKGHHGIGNWRICIAEKSDLYAAMPLIRQAWQVAAEKCGQGV